MKSFLITLTAIFVSTALCFGQFSAGLGITLPTGAYKNLNAGSADLGYQINLSWDKELSNNYGISTAFLLGQNNINGESEAFDSGKWSYLTVGGGLYVSPINSLKIIGIFSVGSFGTPVILEENRGFTQNTFGAGINLKIKYKICKFYVAGNLLYANPDFEFFGRQQISTVGLLAGYTF